MKLTITLIHNSTFPATTYGGSERITWGIARELTRLGHKVFLIAKPNSICDFATVINYTNNLSLNNLIPKETDIVHFQSSPNQKINKPFVITIHGNGQVNEEFHYNSIFVSKNHAKRHNSNIFVHNFINVDAYKIDSSIPKKNQLSFLAKAKWKVKNVKGAIELAKATKLKLNIMGGFRLSINPLIKWHGMVDQNSKIHILNQTKALLFPVRWNEPFGIAIIEAMALGLPVFGTPYGSLPELIGQENGFLSNKKSEIVNALKNIHQYNGKNIRNYIKEKFNPEKAVQKYLEYYEHVLKGRKLNKEQPKTLSTLPPEQLLPWL